MDSNHLAPVEPAELTDQELLRTYNEELLQTYNARNYINEERVMAATIAGLRAVIAADRAMRPTPAEPADHFRNATEMVAPPADGEVIDLVGCVQEWAARLDEGTPEERLLGRVAYVLRQRQAPPHEGEIDALIKILSRIAGMLDFMPDGPPDGLVIHRAIELLRQLTSPAEGEVGELVAALRRRAAQNPLGTADPVITRAAALLQQLATLRQERPHG